MPISEKTSQIGMIRYFIFHLTEFSIDNSKKNF